MILHPFAGCDLRLYPETLYCETVFADGAKAPATRDCEVGNLTYARHLGYADCWPALVDHEAAHTWLAQKMGHPFSPVLYAVAHDFAPGTAPYEVQLAEEAVVLAFQRYVLLGRVGCALRHPDVYPHLYEWATEFRALSRQLLRGATRCQG